MFEEYVCPECLAFQNPTTGECLVCGRKFTKLSTKPIEICGDTAPSADWYYLPINWGNRKGFTTFYAKPSFQIESGPGSYSARLVFEVMGTPEEELFKLFIVN